MTVPLSFSLGNEPVCICSSCVCTHCLSLAFAHTCANCSHPLRAFQGRLSSMWEEVGDLVQMPGSFALNLEQFAAAAAVVHGLEHVLLEN